MSIADCCRAPFAAGRQWSAVTGEFAGPLLRLGDIISSRSMGAHGQDRQKASTDGVTRSSMEVLPRKIGRNERCYCGSGKKFKRCCGVSPGRLIWA
jgi:hypothetical protein